MLAVKAHEVRFELVSGRLVRAPKRDGMIHDEDSASWPRCSVLVGPYVRGTRDAHLDGKAKRYYGPGYQGQSSEITLPPRDLGDWTELGQVRRIFYVRAGNIFGGTRFKHKFKAKVLDWLFRRKPATLYRHGKWLRLELPGGCVVNWRGFVAP